ncbi:MAG: acyltransferase domain-containing protein [Polyangiaceae bacterium]
MRSLVGDAPVVFMFPGQSSRDPEMFSRLAAHAPDETRLVLGVASELVGRDLAAHYQPSNGAGMFATNLDVQLAVFLANHAHLLAAMRSGLDAHLSLGLSLGEFNHLVHIGALDFADAIRLVDARGRAYDEGPPGAMASVFPLDLEEVEAVVERVRARGLVLECANLNSPAQTVISGDPRAIELAAELFEEEHGIDVVVIEQRIAMHSSLFAPVGDSLAPIFASAPFRRPSRPYLPNVLGTFEPEPSAANIATHLTAHVSSPVRFRHAIETIVELAPNATFVEVGPRSVLFNLLSRKWLQNRRLRTDVPGGARAAGAELTVTA